MILLACLVTGVGFLTLGVSMPLIRRKVPMNGLYGIRIPASFQSEQRWYDINEYGGRLLARWSLGTILAGLAGFMLPASAFLTYAWTALAVVLICVLAPALQILRWAGRQPASR